MRGGLDDALERLARRDELRRRTSPDSSTPPAVTELAEAVAAVVARHPDLAITMGVEGAGPPTLLRVAYEDGTVHVSAENPAVTAGPKQGFDADDAADADTAETAAVVDDADEAIVIEDDPFLTTPAQPAPAYSSARAPGAYGAADHDAAAYAPAAQASATYGSTAHAQPATAYTPPAQSMPQPTAHTAAARAGDAGVAPTPAEAARTAAAHAAAAHAAAAPTAPIEQPTEHASSWDETTAFAPTRPMAAPAPSRFEEQRSFNADFERTRVFFPPADAGGAHRSSMGDDPVAFGRPTPAPEPTSPAPPFDAPEFVGFGPEHPDDGGETVVFADLYKPSQPAAQPPPLAEPIPYRVDPGQAEQAAQRLAALLREDPSLLQD